MTGVVTRFGSLAVGTRFRFLMGTTTFLKLTRWRALPAWKGAGLTPDPLAWVVVL